jgi:hypothetical protein
MYTKLQLEIQFIRKQMEKLEWENKTEEEEEREELFDC